VQRLICVLETLISGPTSFCNTAAKCIDGVRWCKLVLDLLVLQIFFWRL